MPKEAGGDIDPIFMIKFISRLGRFTRDGSLWENMVPFWTADNAQ